MLQDTNEMFLMIQEGRYSCAQRTLLGSSAVEVRMRIDNDPVAYGGTLFVRTAHATQDCKIQ